MSKDCPTAGPMSCNFCKEEGHIIKDCPTRPPMSCFACKEEGHMSKDCPTRGPLICSNCNQEGKFSLTSAAGFRDQLNSNSSTRPQSRQV